MQTYVIGILMSTKDSLKDELWQNYNENLNLIGLKLNINNLLFYLIPHNLS